ALRLALRVTGAAGVGLVGVTAVGASSGAARAAWGATVPVDLAVVVAVGACGLGLLLVLVSAAVVRGVAGGVGIWWAVGAVVLASVLWHGGPAPLAAAFAFVTMGALARLLAGPALVGPASTWPEVERRLESAVVDGQPDVTVIVPFFNPGADRLRRHLLELVHTLEREGVAFELLAVSDGSTDGSDMLAADLAARGVRVLALPRNSGKGAALRAGLCEAHGRYLGFIDADGDLPADLWHHFLTLMRLYEADMVVGSKHHPLSQVRYPSARRVMSRVYRRLVRLLFRVDVTDTQTGIKLFRREVLADVLPYVVESGFVFDLELLVVARRHGWRRVLEAPVRVEHQFRSTISTRTAVEMLASTLVLAVRVYVLRRYDTPSRRADGQTALRLEGATA
ncbi:MAG TPA: glycosyltransferase, partial [Acidimicrobiia bacterium]|nr:glycosyltransferase [Acidimicrobiia bacterium]